jgi:catechol 2,3-dioxygenase
MTSEGKLHRGTSIGHVHLKVADLDRAIKFYRDILGFELTTKMGNGAAFLSVGGYHHHIGLNTWESYGGTPPPQGTTGLYHFAIVLPSRKELAKTLKRIIENGYPLDGAAHHGVSESIYLTDPDGNGIELYYDIPKSKWKYNADGSILMTTMHLDLNKLLEDADS